MTANRIAPEPAPLTSEEVAAHFAGAGFAARRVTARTVLVSLSSRSVSRLEVIGATPAKWDARLIIFYPDAGAVQVTVR